jgi:predicted dehydrogenase
LTDYKKLPELGVAAASVVSTTSSHFEIASWLLQNGIDVLVEKPMTVTIKEADELIAIAAENGRILQVGHLERFNPAFRAMKQVLTDPVFFEVRRIAQFAGRGHDVDVVRDLMIHDIDIVSHLVGQEVVAVANVTASRAAFKTERSFRVFQPNAYLVLDFGKRNLKIYTKKGEYDELSGELPNIDYEEHPVQERDALEHEVESFLESVANRSVPEVTGEDGKRALQLADMITAAFEEKMQSMPVLQKLAANA